MKRAEKGKGKSSTAKRKSAAAVSKETTGGGDATPIGDGAADDGALERQTDTAAAVGADAVGQRWVEPHVFPKFASYLVM